MKWSPTSILPEDIEKAQPAFNMKAIVGQLQGKRGQHVVNGSGAEWRMVSPRANGSVNGALLIQRRGMDPKSRKTKWVTVSSFGADGVISQTTKPVFSDITLTAPWTANGSFQQAWMSDGSVLVRGSLTINGAANGSTIATNLYAPAVTETFSVMASAGATSVTLATTGTLTVGTIPGGSTTITLSFRYVPAQAYDMGKNGQEPQL